jgi:chorismate mutase
MRAISDIRAEIDAIDDEIVDLLARRFALAPQVIAYKHAHGLPAVIQSRIDEVINRNVARATSKGVDGELVENLYRAIITKYCELEEEILH